LPELLELARAKAGSVTWGSYGLTSPPYLYIEWLKKAKGVEFLNVPYKAASFAWPAMLSGEVQVSYFALTGNALQMVKAGKARTLAVTMEKRSPELPDVPTYREAGLDFAIVSWFALCAPAATPREIVARLNNVVNNGLIENPEARAKFLSSQGIETDPPAGGSPEAIAQYFAAEQKRYSEIVRITGVKED
jgi:tripartite-type tricarboxylate transporter receptor subunit TctC